MAVAGLLPALAILCLTMEARAQGVCVVCSEPEATYRCQADASVPIRPGDARLNLLCITELARAGSHGSCSVRRQQTANCDGQLRTVAISPSSPSSVPSPIAGQVPVAPAAVQTEADPADPPDTVAEFAKRTATTSQQQLEKATGAVGEAAKKTGNAVGAVAIKTGDAVGDAAKKTGSAVGNAAQKSWHCLTSLFKDC